MIRNARTEDLDRILEIYSIAKQTMARNGNPTQWGPDYPSKALLSEDIRQDHLFVITRKDTIHGVFAFIVGEDPTYTEIADGAWLNDEPYGTIHRLASDASFRGLFGICLDYCQKLIPNLRIDTHTDNTVMRHLIEKHGFIRCGIVTVGDGTTRIAYQKPPVELVKPSPKLAFVILMENLKPLNPALIERHVEYLKRLEAEDRLILCGPFSDHPGGMVVIRAQSLEEAHCIAQTDPFIAYGVKSYVLRTLEVADASNHYGLDS